MKTFTPCIAIALAWTAAAQTVTVVGTGDPSKDIPSVQSAVDRGGQVVLQGHFSFDAAPTTPAGETFARTVTVSKGVEILGGPDQNGEMPVIAGGFIPFFVEAPGAFVTIQGLHFVRSKGAAVWVYAASGLVIQFCRVEGVEASAELAAYANQANPLGGAISVMSVAQPPSAANPGHPENLYGSLLILDNDIDVGAAPGTQTLGIVILAAGKSPDKEADIYVFGNTIRNTTEPAINLRVIGGRAQLEWNAITTGAVAAGNPDAIRIVGSGSYLIAHNSIDCGWADGTGSGINLVGQAFSPEAGAIVVDNDVTMSAPAGTTFGSTNSAGIEIGGFAQGNEVLNNRIRGRARAALSLIGRNMGTPGNNTFVSNDLSGFQSSLADAFVDAGVAKTVVVGRQGQVEDHGTGTVIVPTP